MLTFHNENWGNVNFAESYNQSKVFEYQSLHNQNFFFIFQKYVIIMLSSDITKYTFYTGAFNGKNE